MVNENKHIKEKSVIEHLAKARQKGYLASVELHNFGFSSKLFSFLDSYREGVLLFTLIFLALGKMIWPIAIGFCLWKGLKTALQGFNRLERLHYLVKEEKYEIEHHRDEEREELMAIYEAKGFKSPLLEEVVATLMADDNRLLQVMLEEEMGVSFETLDHPCITAAMSTLGALTSLATMTVLSFVPWGLLIGSCLVMGAVAIYESKKQKLPSFHNVTWSLASLIFVLSIAHFINKIVN